jgi:hypothetical protein
MQPSTEEIPETLAPLGNVVAMHHPQPSSTFALVLSACLFLSFPLLVIGISKGKDFKEASLIGLMMAGVQLFILICLVRSVFHIQRLQKMRIWIFERGLGVRTRDGRVIAFPWDDIVRVERIELTGHKYSAPWWGITVRRGDGVSYTTGSDEATAFDALRVRIEREFRSRHPTPDDAKVPQWIQDQGTNG